MNRPFALDAVGDYRTKATLGITGSFRLRVHIDGGVRHLDVGSSYPGAGENIPSLPVGNDRVINKLNTVKAYSCDYAEFPAGPRSDTIRYMKANAVGKIIVEVDCAYLAGLIDGDGAIMATIERHNEKKFGWRIRIECKITQKEATVLRFLSLKYRVGRVVANRTTYDWIIRDRNDVHTLLGLISPYSLTKKRQIQIALTILDTKIESEADLVSVAQLADTLSKYNVRSKGRRRNYATMIQTSISPND